MTGEALGDRYCFPRMDSFPEGIAVQMDGPSSKCGALVVSLPRALGQSLVCSRKVTKNVRVSV